MPAMRVAIGCTIVSIALLGCKTTRAPFCAPGASTVPTVALSSAPNAGAPVAPVTTVAYQEPLPQPEAQQITGEPLTREWLQAEVEARNPSLEAMVAAWQAAAQLYPQRVALDDPVLMGMIAPESVGADETETAYAFQLNQKLPWFGKRSLRGAVAAADADAAYHDAEDARLQVRLAADLAFFDYLLVTQQLEINRENTGSMQESRETAQSRYRTGVVMQQDILQADLELADLARRQLELARMRDVAVARINTLLRRWPEAPLPPPSATLDTPRQPADVSLLWQTALQTRPDLAALAWRVQSEEAALELAYKNYHPDFDVFTRYDTFWQPASAQGPLRAQLGVAVNLPVYREKLHAAVCEAQFRLNQRRAEFEQRTLDIQYQVVRAAREVEESYKAIELYQNRLVPTAEQNVAALRSNYLVGKATFLDLAQAQRQLISISERRIEALVAYHRRLSDLDRLTGSSALSSRP